MRQLSSDERGVSIIELAFVAPIFALLILGIGDLARGFSEKLALQQAANRTMEIGQIGSNNDSYAYLQAKAVDAAKEAGHEDATATLSQWLECNGNRNAPKAWTDDCAATEEIARYITITINSSFKPAFSSVGYPGARADGTVPISAKASLRVQ